MKIKLSAGGAGPEPYSEDDIRAALLASEGKNAQGVPSKKGGHAIHWHDLIHPGTGRTNPNLFLENLRGRFLEKKFKNLQKSGAFQNGLVPALRFALNSPSGQIALGHLTMADVLDAGITVDIAAGAFRVVLYVKSEGTLAPDGQSFLPAGERSPKFWRPRTAVAQGMFIKLVKAGSDEVHIQTAFPLAEMTPPSQVELRRLGGTDLQVLPI